MDEQPSDRPPILTGGSSGKTRRSIGRALRAVAGVLLAAVALLLVVQNQEPTQTRFLTWSVEMPRFALLAFVYLLGAATGWFLHRKRRR